jgi:SPP1 gp7 family putative phage head morphogenesis protein
MRINGTTHKATKATIDQLPLDLGDVIEKLMRKYYPLLVSRAWGDAQAVVGVDIAFDLDNPYVQEILDELAQDIRGITETTRADIQQLLGQQAIEGWSTEELARRLRERGVTESARRARLIASTETASAYSRGSLLYYQESGVVSGTEWLATDPCEICEPLADKVVDLGEEFAPGISFPPAHPACRCALAPIIS